MSQDIRTRDFAPACTLDPETWFPTPGDNGTTAKRFCNACPAVEKCLDLALEHEADLQRSSRYGIWGGMTPQERADEAAMRRAEQRAGLGVAA